MFIDSMQFVNSDLDKLGKNLSDEDFKYLVEEFGSENSQNKKVSILTNTWTVLKGLMKKNNLLGNIFLVQ